MKRLLGVGAGFLVLAGVTVYIAGLPLFRDAPPDTEQVVLLHGLGRSEMSMLLMENALAGAGFEVHNIGYPSTELSSDALVTEISTAIDDCCADNGRTLNLVGHSLGGLLIRAYLAGRHPANLGRVVLIGTPNHGSELADLDAGLLGTLVDMAGPTARMLGTGSEDFPASLPPPDYPLGVIAGTRDAIVTNEWLPQPNDSMVSTASVRLDGMTDYVEFPVTHWGLRNDGDVARAVIRFLRTGAFRTHSRP